MCLLSFDSPINFLRSSKSNRFAIAATFGATASTCLDLALSSDLSHINFFPKDSTPWVKGVNTLQLILSVHASLIISDSLLRAKGWTNSSVSP